MNAILRSNWETLLYLMSWHQFKDTIPGLFCITVFCLYNSLTSKQYLLYSKRYIWYVILCYFFYILHSFSANIEEKIFGSIAHFFDIVVLLIILFEFSIFFQYGERTLLIVIPLLSYGMQRISSFIQSLIPSIIKRKRTSDNK